MVVTVEVAPDFSHVPSTADSSGIIADGGIFCDRLCEATTLSGDQFANNDEIECDGVTINSTQTCEALN